MNRSPHKIISFIILIIYYKSNFKLYTDRRKRGKSFESRYIRQHVIEVCALGNIIPKVAAMVDLAHEYILIFAQIIIQLKCVSDCFDTIKNVIFTSLTFIYSLTLSINFKILYS